MKKTEFVRKGKATSNNAEKSVTGLVKELPPGCYPSTANTHLLLTSLGLAELDDFSDGGETLFSPM